MKTLATFDSKGNLIVDAAGRSEFDNVRRNDDGSTRTEKDDVEILTEKDGRLFVDALGRSEFDWVYRNPDGETRTEKDDVIITTKADGSLRK